MQMRTPGRRYFETHWHIRLAGAVSILMLLSSSIFLFTRVEQLRKPHNPHYEKNHCFDCHEARGSKMKAQDCFECHNMLTRALLPGAFEKREKIAEKKCFHPVKTFSSLGMARPVTDLCLSCHKTVKGYVALVNINTKMYVEFDMAETHPIGLMPTDTIYPKTLPLSKETGAINCITCHDQHGMDRRMKLLRYYYPGNGRPADFRPLCNDCHENDWMPLSTVGKRAVVTDPRKTEPPHHE